MCLLKLLRTRRVPRSRCVKMLLRLPTELLHIILYKVHSTPARKLLSHRAGGQEISKSALRSLEGSFPNCSSISVRKDYDMFGRGEIMLVG